MPYWMNRWVNLKVIFNDLYVIPPDFKTTRKAAPVKV